MPPRDPECWVFVSHIHEDEPVALWLKRRLESDFLGSVGVYVSSEAPAGADWFPHLEAHLRKSAFLLALCSPISVQRPWIHFEVGAAWALHSVVIPVCHDGQAPGELDDPFGRRFAVTLTDAGGLRKLYAQIVEQLEMQPGDWDFEAYARQVPAPEPVEGPADDNAAGAVDPNGLIRRQLHQSLMTRQPWRTLGWLTTEAGLEDEAMVRTVLLADDEVRFSRAKSGKLIAGLKSRVGP